MKMKMLFAIFGLLLFPLIAFCQTGISPNPGQVISRMIDTGTLEGQDSMVLGGMGDAAAVTVTKVLAGRILSTNEIDIVLIVLSRSFADPRGVAAVPDRKPRTTLFVLAYLDSSTKDPELKKRIAHTRKYVQDQYEKSKKEESQKKK